MNRARLATVVRVRRIQERIARGEVARDRGVVAGRELAADAAAARLDDVSTTTPDRPTSFVAHRRMLGSGVREVERATDDVRAARARLDGTVRSWTHAAQRLEGVERLDERAAAAADASAERAERVELDDLVVMRWTEIDDRAGR